MSFFSYLSLAANTGFRSHPDEALINEMCLEIALTIISEFPSGLYNLHPSVKARFKDDVAIRRNDKFFSPDSVGIITSVWVSSFDAEEPYTGSGFQIQISGNGYFFPWTKSDLVTLVQSPPFSDLKQKCDDLFGGFLQPPLEAKQLFEEAIIGSPSGWTWLKSET